MNKDMKKQHMDINQNELMKHSFKSKAQACPPLSLRRLKVSMKVERFDE